MQTAAIGQSELRSTRVIYGCMRVLGTWNRAEMTAQRRREALSALEAAVEAGYNHFDHADIYAHGESERVFGEFLAGNPGLRERLIITTKCGIRWEGEGGPGAPHRYDFSRDWIERSCETSLRRLGVDTIDVYLLHRPDVLMDPDEIAGVFDRLHASGKVRHFGVSNFTSSQTALLQSRLSRPLVCNQIEVHPLRLAPIEDGTIDDLCRLRITATSWSPVAGGRLFAAPGDDPKLARLVSVLDEEACAHGVSRTGILIAWLLRHPATILPIYGSRQPQRIRDAVAGDAVVMSRESWYRIYLAARGKALS
ncbi:MAG: aldo/keto reductase [Leptolyngbya sp. PLA3]|nr:MAG: aldo/keto reductase [Cyanobacteria bacterium CYA]MCE7969603.1 aldo/keto reductase [Leptolyngbya sp. PL-A3]